MHDIKYFENHADEVKENLKKRDFDLSVVDKVLTLNGERKELLSFLNPKEQKLNLFPKKSVD